jgi:hypothetical protein
MPNGKQLITTAAIALAVLLAYEHFKSKASTGSATSRWGV